MSTENTFFTDFPPLVRLPPPELTPLFDLLPPALLRKMQTTKRMREKLRVINVRIFSDRHAAELVSMFRLVPVELLTYIDVATSGRSVYFSLRLPPCHDSLWPEAPFTVHATFSTEGGIQNIITVASTELFPAGLWSTTRFRTTTMDFLHNWHHILSMSPAHRPAFAGLDGSHFSLASLPDLCDRLACIGFTWGLPLTEDAVGLLLKRNQYDTALFPSGLILPPSWAQRAPSLFPGVPLRFCSSDVLKRVLRRPRYVSKFIFELNKGKYA